MTNSFDMIDMTGMESVVDYDTLLIECLRLQLDFTKAGFKSEVLEDLISYYKSKVMGIYA